MFLVIKDTCVANMSTVKFFRHSTKLSRYYIPTEFVILAAIEFTALIFSLYLAFVIRFWGGGWQFDYNEFMPKALAYAVVMQLCLVAFGVYQRQTGRLLTCWCCVLPVVYCSG